MTPSNGPGRDPLRTLRGVPREVWGLAALVSLVGGGWLYGMVGGGPSPAEPATPTTTSTATTTTGTTAPSSSPPMSTSTSRSTILPPSVSSTTTPRQSGTAVAPPSGNTADTTIAPALAAAQQRLLTRVVVPFSEFDPSVPNPVGKWISTIPAVDTTSSFRALLRSQASRLWDNATTLGVRVEGATLRAADRLWTSGSDSLWRVTVARSLVSTDGSGLLDGQDLYKVDILVTVGDTLQTKGFAAPTADNEKLGSFKP